MKILKIKKAFNRLGRLVFFALFFSLTVSATAFASTCYYTNDTANDSWTDTGNWADTSGGTGGTCSGATGYPGAADIAILDGAGDADNVGGNRSVVLPFSSTITGITVNTGYTKSVTVGNNVTISGTTTVNSGTLGGIGTLLTMNGPLVIGGGTVDMSLVTTLDLNSNFTFTSGSFSAPTTFEVSGTFNQSTSGTTYTSNGKLLVLNYAGVTAQTLTIPATTALGDLEIDLSGGASMSIATALSTTGTLTLTNGSLTGAGSLSVTGNMYMANTFGAVGVPINMTGTTASEAFLQGTINGVLTLNNPNMVLSLSDSTQFGTTVNILQGTFKPYVINSTDSKHVVSSTPVVVNTVFVGAVNLSGGSFDAKNNVGGLEPNSVTGPFTFSNNFTQTGGIFDAGSMDVTFAQFTATNGTFTSGTGDYIINGNAYWDYSHTGSTAANNKL